MPEGVFKGYVHALCEMAGAALQDAILLGDVCKQLGAQPVATHFQKNFALLKRGRCV